MATVQIIGRDAILSAFRDLGHDTFALFNGKQLIVAGEGEADLSTWIDRFCPPGISGSFVLRLYDCEVSEVKQNTDYVACLYCRVMEGYNGPGAIGGFPSSLTKRIEGLEKKLESPQEDNRITDALMGWLEEPEKLIQVIGAVKGLLGMSAPVEAVPAAIGAITPKIVGPGELTQDEEVRYRKLAAALDKLEKRDPRIVEHLEKLAEISVSEPGTFNMMTKMLDNR